MFQAFEVEIHGAGSLLMHNGRLADNRDPFVRELKRYTKRKSKTDDDADTIELLEWAGGLYHSGTAEIESGVVKFSKDARVVMPADNLWSCIVDGGRVMKIGKSLESALIVEADGVFAHNGPENINELAADQKFRSRKRAKVGMAAVMRTRPKFPWWQCLFTLQLDTEQVTEDQLAEALKHAGTRKGLCDWTPRYGRFTVERLKAVKN